MSDLTIVVAIDAQRGIGVNNTLPWHIPEDLAHFKRLTSGHPIIMGRKTFDSIGRALPNRRNIVVTRDPAWQRDKVEAVLSLEAALALVASTETAFIIGGAQIFAASMELADRMVITEIEHTFECDTFFPPLPPGWVETARVAQASEPSQTPAYRYAFVTYDRVG